jgi:hypothetical protein
MFNHIKGSPDRSTSRLPTLADTEYERNKSVS